MSSPADPSVEFCGELYQLTPDRPLTVGRVGDIAIDDNPYLHRQFLQFTQSDGMVWLANVGSQLTATVADADGLTHAYLAPGARVPIVFARTRVWFTAGPTSYELEIQVPDSAYEPVASEPFSEGQTTLGKMSFTPDQLLLVLALAERMLRGGTRGAGAIPSSADAAERLGWTITKFNAKLNNVCERLTKNGIRGLRGDPGRLATSRRGRLVEYALAARLVTADDLVLLDTLDSQREGRDDQ